MEFTRMNKHIIFNLSETQFYGLIDKINQISTKIDLSGVRNPILRAVLVLIDQLPLRQKKKISTISSTDVVRILADPMIKIVMVSF
jgi:hypothetical protein